MQRLIAFLAPTLLALLTQGAAAQGIQQATPVARPNLVPQDLALQFLEPYGIQNFSAHHVSALQTFLDVETHYDAGQYAAAKAKLDALWSSYPESALSWNALPKKPFGINIGSPPAYYGLRMLTDMVEWRIASGVTGDVAPRTVRLTVLLVGNSSGIEPASQEQLNQGTGTFVQHTLDPKLALNDHFVIHQSLQLFRDYVFAATEGKLAVETNILPLPQVDLPVSASVLPGGGKFAGLTNASAVFDHVSQADQDATDWWWVLYPSHVPEQYPDFTNAEFITGGMGTGPDSTSPFFIIDDRWLIRKPPHIGTGTYSQVERRAYLPQWLQHEFYHHLFRTYPEFGLEDTPHQWFNPSTWPADFVGLYEPDYYHEALIKRLQLATPPLHVTLRYATADAPWDQIALTDVLADYERLPILNAWHTGSVQQIAGNSLLWMNDAGVSWTLQADLLNGALYTGPDCPYFGNPNAQAFNILLEKNAFGDLLPQVRGFAFLGETYSQKP